MFLKSLDIYGFKSFADKTYIDFAGGITSLLGPNGCGKSNIVDSIKWVLGEKSTKSLRAGKMEDVIFNGTDTRKPMPFAEVELTIDNSEHQLPTDVAEVAIKRRYFRTGESEYFLNGQKCLLKNIRELFFDTGVGKSAYSILEQGKIDQILSTKPEDRRYLFEEAAGISRYKEQCHSAELDLEKTAQNIEDITRSYNEAKRACDRSRSQAEKAKRARELEARAFDLDVRYNLARIRTYSLMKEQRERARDHERRAHARGGDLVVVGEPLAVHDDLQVLEAGAVVEHDEAKVLHVADRADPARHGDGGAAELVHVGEELRDVGAFHGYSFCETRFFSICRSYSSATQRAATR